MKAIALKSGLDDELAARRAIKFFNELGMENTKKIAKSQDHAENEMFPYLWKKTRVFLNFWIN